MKRADLEWEAGGIVAAVLMTILAAPIALAVLAGVGLFIVVTVFTSLIAAVVQAITGID